MPSKFKVKRVELYDGSSVEVGEPVGSLGALKLFHIVTPDSEVVKLRYANQPGEITIPRSVVERIELENPEAS